MVRNNRLDSLKGLLIILVIIGHAILMVGRTNPVNHAVMGFIYVFHMPLFILISGYFAKSADEQSSSDMWRGTINLFIIMMLFHLISSIRVHFVGGDFVEAFKAFPFDVLWYLLSLIYWRIMLYYTPKCLLDRPALHIGIAVAVSVLCGLTDLGTFLSIQRTLNFYFFFLLGYYYRHGAINPRWWKNNTLHLITAAVMLPTLFWLYPHCGNIMNGADYYPLSGIPEKVLVLICSVSMSLLVFNIVRDNKLLRTIGKDSLFYYVYHIYFINSLLFPLQRAFDIPTSFPFILIYTAIIVGLLLLLNKIPFFRWLVQPFIKKPK